MIELRWIKTSEWIPATQEFKMILQYREYRILKYNDGKGTSYEEKDYSEWRDVPIEESK